MPLNMKLLALSATLALAACTHPADVTRPQPAMANPDTGKFIVNDLPTGFSVEVSYSHYQFVPNMSEMHDACASLIRSRVAEEATRRGRAIEPIGDQAIRVSTGRNLFLGVSSCRGFVQATWK